MKINLEKLEKKCWFEDKTGNVVDKADPKVRFYRSCFPLELHNKVYSYKYKSSKNKLIKYLCRKSKEFNKFYFKNKIKTFEVLIDEITSYSSEWAQKCIVAMVNSSDYTLEQAVWVFTNACERCKNALLFKYLNGTTGYEEYSDSWKKCNTSCDFCRADKVTE